MAAGIWIWLPLATATVIVVAREARRPPVPDPAAPGVSVELPDVRGSAVPRGAAEFELDSARSSVRFIVSCGGSKHAFRCADVRGTLVLEGDGTARLEFDLDLGALQRLDSDDAVADRCDLWHVLGANKNSKVSYAATLVSSATTPLPCLSQKTWIGSLRFGSRVVRQPMALWQTALPGQPLRMQGHGTVMGEAYGLLRHSLLSLLDERDEVTLGLDIAWKRKKLR